MKSSFIATGGALLAAAALVIGGAGAALAGDKDDDGAWEPWQEHGWASHYPEYCSLGLNDDSTYQHITSKGVFMGTRDSDGCKGKKDDQWRGGGDDGDDDDGDDDGDGDGDDNDDNNVDGVGDSDTKSSPYGGWWSRNGGTTGVAR